MLLLGVGGAWPSLEMVFKDESIKKLFWLERRAGARDPVRGRPRGRAWSQKRAPSAGTQLVQRWEVHQRRWPTGKSGRMKTKEMLAN